MSANFKNSEQSRVEKIKYLIFQNFWRQHMPKSNQAPVGLFFEVVPNSGHLHHYFSYVEKLKPELEKHKGLIWLNRYEAQLDDYSLLSHQLWDSEKSLENWRQNKQHRLAQKAGIKKHFKDYRIRIGQRLACWQANLVTETNFELTSKSDALLVSIQSRTVISNTAFNKHAVLDGAYNGLSASDQFITLVTPNDLPSVKALTSLISTDSIDKIELFLISRDYSMTNRIQAPRDS
ncbi:antibiotic biosynthesis monooxygenase [Alphaproteobacteria bacterium]|nr:antibiotic biosynthesis monooxygenase [Alphaproteobacteria bacterium]MDB3896340.1 antibiotic biosynthesis monooxygenase [Alphaproteobacteria bacterium]MDC3193599.1 antibiotic biosynthesis monooxygenase [Alphaproteobacteria bacterium]